MITIVTGDLEFQKTLTPKEKQYIHEGQNWISKSFRETQLKSLHLINHTLDEVDAMDEETQKKVWNEADIAWTKKCLNIED